MFDIERWQEIFETLRKNKLRTFLTGLSVASGIFILVILLGFSRGLENGVKSEFERDATNLITVWTGVTTKGYKGLNPGRYIQMKNENFDFISEKYKSNIEHETALYSIWGADITYKNESVRYQVRGAMPGHQFIENADMETGRFVSEIDLEENRKIAVIGRKLRQDLFKDEDPINKDIKIFGMSFKVVGVFIDPGGEREEQQAYIPLTTAQKVFGAGDDIRNILVTVKMSDDFEEAVQLSNKMSDAIESELKQMHTVSPEDTSAIRVFNTLEEAKKIYGLIDMIQLVFWIIGVLTIIAGVVGVGNIMLIIVKERTKEIGIRKALGALPISIIGMILQEAIFVTMFAGLFGLIFGLGLLELLGPQIEHDFIKYPQVDFNIAISAVFVLVFAGAVAGFFPAYRAAKIRPIVALRDE
ncbi:ABC transporter permease [Psychroserpens sp. MEBiC05023]